MIIVTGTKRSGTSMWMQVLRAAGVKTIGIAFGKLWKETIKDANRRGFYESNFRRGIYYATNPVPATGKWLHPGESRHWGVKVFIPGVVRSDVVYLSRVIASVRPFREYAHSLTRLYEMERRSHETRGTHEALSPHLDPVLEWWVENFLLLRDITTRRYPARLISYETMLAEPLEVCERIFGWLGTGDAQLGAEAVFPEERTQTEQDVSGFSHEFEEVFDDYHERVKNGVPFDEAFLQKMNETHLELLPQIEVALGELSQKSEERKQRLRQAGTDKKLDPLNIDRLDLIFHPPDLGKLST